MTAREKLAMEHPEDIGDFYGGCLGCPTRYGYLPDPDWCGTDHEPEDKCTICWNREIPGTKPTNTKKESKTMEKKTKAQLIEEIRAMQKEIEKLDKYRKYEETANEMYAVYESFISAGFTKDQAWELLITSMKMATAHA